jgi:hypothetical protein
VSTRSSPETERLPGLGRAGVDVWTAKTAWCKEGERTAADRKPREGSGAPRTAAEEYGQK